MSAKLTMSAKNKAFWKLSPSKQRIAIAKDVLLSLKLKKLEALSGVYLGFVMKKQIKKADTPHKLDSLFRKKEVACQVCGIGACFFGLVNLGNSAPTADFILGGVKRETRLSDGNMRELLRKVFPSAQLTLIECAFEESNGFNDYGSDGYYAKPINKEKAKNFGNKFDNDEDRLKAIMGNIIKHKGTFKP
jgi:hypothetical protein